MTVDIEQLSCQELVELVTDYFEGALSETDRARFEDHIGRCDPCTIYLEQMRLTIELVGHVPVESLSADAERALLEAFRGWRAS
jgi:anti-sigma factor RsiW